MKILPMNSNDKQTHGVSIHGAQGSYPGTSTANSFCSNTSCVSIKTYENKQLIFDAGTGIIRLGQILKGKKEPIYIVFSHFHWDHIQGIPFFEPLYEKDRDIYFIGFHQLNWKDLIINCTSLFIEKKSVLKHPEV